MKSLALASLLLAQEHTVVFHNSDREFYVEGCGLARLDDASLLAVVPVVPRAEWSKERRAKQSRTHVLRSADDGKTWSEPVTLFKGHFWKCHAGMTVRDHYLYWAVDDLALGSKRGPRVVAGDLSANLMDPRAWRISNPVPFPGVPSALTHPKFAQLSSQYLEPNVINVRGQLRVLMTVKPNRQSTAGLCAVLDLNDDGGKLNLKFTQYHPRPGGQLKFYVLWDKVSQMFWSTANLVTDSQGTFGTKDGGNDRRFLMLFYGVDGLNWFQAGCVAQARTMEQSFMYAAAVIDGNDLAIISRSNINGPNRHDADCATFHRVRDFRRLALKLAPDLENQ